jgi:hypothetical protein
MGVWVRDDLGSYFGQETSPCDRRFAFFFKETATTSILTQNFDYDCREKVYFFIIVSEVRLSPLGIAATSGLLYQPQMIDDGDCGKIGGMKIGRGNRSTRKKPAPAPLCPPQNPT